MPLTDQAERLMARALGDAGAGREITDRVGQMDVTGEGDAQQFLFPNVVVASALAVGNLANLTQTYSTADSTHAAPTSGAITDSTNGQPGDTVQEVPVPSDSPSTADALRDDLANNVIPQINDNLSTLVTEYNELRADVLDLKQFVNSFLDALQ